MSLGTPSGLASVTRRGADASERRHQGLGKRGSSTLDRQVSKTHLL